MTIIEQCARRPPGGPACPRLPEVSVHFISFATGKTTRKETVCPVHAFESLGRAFVDVNRPNRELLTVVVTPL